MKRTNRRKTIGDPKARREFWLKQVKSFLYSGKTTRQYSADMGISQFSLRDWKQRFAKEFGPEWVESCRNTAGKEKQAEPEAQFFEVDLNGNCKARQQPEDEAPSAVPTVAWKIKTPDGYSLSAPPETKVADVVALIKLLKEASC
jgi:hypothetical protein